MFKSHPGKVGLHPADGISGFWGYNVSRNVCWGWTYGAWNCLLHLRNTCVIRAASAYPVSHRGFVPRCKAGVFRLVQRRVAPAPIRTTWERSRDTASYSIRTLRERDVQSIAEAYSEDVVLARVCYGKETGASCEEGRGHNVSRSSKHRKSRPSVLGRDLRCLELLATPTARLMAMGFERARLGAIF